VTDSIKPLFIDQEIEVLEGSAAEQALRTKNDTRFFVPGMGVARVDEQRWQEAQHYERKTWMERGRANADDRNLIHLERFAGYCSLRGQHFERAIELGCGPFTNMRIILQEVTAEEVHLLDPLIMEYTNHPLCRYRHGKLGGVGAIASLEGLTSMRSPRGWLREVFNSVRIGGVRGREVQLEPSAIEDFAATHKFDLVVLINVLEHCQDAERVFAKIWDILTPGGVFVFHDKFYQSIVLAASLSNLYDAGHPIRLDPAVAEAFLRRFDPLMRADFWDCETFAGRELRRQATYFIGRAPGR
jgi:SAM-dependent methyltransferase